MTPKAVKTTRMSLYRLTGVRSLPDGIREELPNDTFAKVELSVGDAEALLISGTWQKDKANWVETISKITSKSLVLGTATPAAVLLVRAAAQSLEDEKLPDAEEDEFIVWALAFGGGYHLLSQNHIDTGFGQRIAIRVANSEELNSLTKTTLDHRAKNERSTIPGGDGLRGFGFGDMGEIVTRLAAKAIIPGLAYGDRSITLRGSDSLNLNLGANAADLTNDLKTIATVLRKKPKPELEVLEQLTVVKNRDQIARLEKNLEQCIVDGNRETMGIAWPHERYEIEGNSGSHRFYHLGSGIKPMSEPTPSLEELLKLIHRNASTDKIRLMKKAKIQLCSDDDGKEMIGGQVPLIKWIAFEADIDDKRYCLHDGKWYMMRQDYKRILDDKVSEIFRRDSPVELPDWPTSNHEDSYNIMAAEKIGGLCLDKKLIKTKVHKYGIEVCDILSKCGALIHVKDLKRSSSASHLFSQALVSTEALSHDIEARNIFDRRILDAGGRPEDFGKELKNVVLGIARKGKRVAAENLFTFSKVTLTRLDQQMARQGFKITVAPIRRPS